jgi:hypothetical protein
VHQQHFHQYPAGLIPAPVAMPVHVPVSQTPYSAQIAVPPPQPLIPPPDHRLHSLPPTGQYPGRRACRITRWSLRDLVVY